MPDRVFHLNAFTDRIFSGNAAAVCLLDGPRDDAWLQKLAQEMGQSSTTFVEPVGEEFRIRWFTVVQELSLNGTGTLCSAHVLWEAGLAEVSQTLRLQSKGGPLAATRDGEWIEMDFPSEKATQVEPTDALVKGLGARPLFAGTSSRGVLAQFESAAAVRALTPDYVALGGVDGRAVIATAVDESGEFDFISRYFGTAGVPFEDPVNGSSHTVLGPFWAERLGKSELLALQASARGGVLRVRPEGERVVLGGKAVTVFSGALSADA
jgi:PhzF family phenazine biosynthesis protein